MMTPRYKTYNPHRRHYAIINRQGTMVRIKPMHRQLSAWLVERFKKYGPMQRESEVKEDHVEFFEKEDFFKICNELKIGMKESFIQIRAEGNFGGLILANKAMKKEVMDGLSFITKAREALNPPKETFDANNEANFPDSQISTEIMSKKEAIDRWPGLADKINNLKSEEE